MPENFNWVQARNECSLAQVFQQLYNDVIGDVEERKALPSRDAQLTFSVTTGKGNFSVVRAINGSIPDSVNFVLSRSEIIAQDDRNTFMLKATITLNNEGRCRLKVGDDELEQWQFRRKALEKLFFAT